MGSSVPSTARSAITMETELAPMCSAVSNVAGSAEGSERLFRVRAMLDIRYD